MGQNGWKVGGVRFRRKAAPKQVPIEEMRWKGLQRGEAGRDEPPQQTPHTPTPALRALCVYL